MKANSNQAVLKTLANLGAGMDIVSEGELRRALAAGVPGQRIVFSGVGKTQDEMAFALDGGICASTWNPSPNSRPCRTSPSPGAAARPSRSASIRTSTRRPTRKSRPANPKQVRHPDARARDVYAHAARLKGLEVIGVDMHIGSQITDLEPFDNAARCSPNWPAT